MCMFCAAMPATIAVGANLQAKQRQERREAEECGQEPRRQIPAMTWTGFVLVALMFVSIIYHSQFDG
ncbi:MAG: hypothetical protein Fur0043_27350 [Anaerolineales bacterium]